MQSMLDAGMRVCLQSYLGVGAGCRLLVRAAPDLMEDKDLPLLDRFCRHAERLGGVPTLRPISPSDPFVPEEIEPYDIVVYASRTASVHRDQVLRYLAARGAQSPSFYRLFNVSVPLFAQCFAMRQTEIDNLNRRLIASARRTRTVHVTSSAGTDLTIELVSDFTWTNSCGRFDGRFPGVLPPGEVNTYSPMINGRIVVDGALNTSFGLTGDPRLGTDPLVAAIRDGRIVSLDCEDPIKRLTLENFLSLDNADRVGEVGFGTNEGVTAFADFVSHINERHPGLHLGLGTPTQSRSKVDWTCPYHVDLILATGDIAFDGTPIFVNGCYRYEVLAPADESGVACLAVDAL